MKDNIFFLAFLHSGKSINNILLHHSLTDRGKTISQYSSVVTNKIKRTSGMCIWWIYWTKLIWRVSATFSSRYQTKISLWISYFNDRNDHNFHCFSSFNKCLKRRKQNKKENKKQRKCVSLFQWKINRSLPGSQAAQGKQSVSPLGLSIKVPARQGWQDVLLKSVQCVLTRLPAGKKTVSCKLSHSLQSFQSFQCRVPLLPVQ